jgi:hypothetical protein
MMHLAMLKTHAQLTLPRVEPTNSLALGVIFYAHQSEKEDDIAEVPILEELESFSNALSLNWQNISGAYDCNSFLSYTVRAGLQLYISKKIQIPILRRSNSCIRNLTTCIEGKVCHRTGLGLQVSNGN